MGRGRKPIYKEKLITKTIRVPRETWEYFKDKHGKEALARLRELIEFDLKMESYF